MTIALAFLAGIVIGLLVPVWLDTWRRRSDSRPQRLAARAGEAWGVKKLPPIFPPEPFDAD